ncbi:unnamed protein product, partial [Polarella glacialis]
EPGLEWRLPVGSDNPASQRFERAFSLLDEVLAAPEEWLPALPPDAMLEVKSQLAASAEASGSEDDEEQDPSLPAPPPSTSSAARRRAFMAEVHERRARNPRAFQEAVRAAGRRPNPSVVDLRPPRHPREDAEEEAALAASALATSSSSSSSSSSGYRRLSERFGGRRHFDLQDIEAMRVEEAIAGMPSYAPEYLASLGTSNSYADLVSRSYDPGYLGRRALDETNIFRASQKMPPLRWCQGIVDIAAEHAQ